MCIRDRANSYSGFFAGSQAFDTGRLGVQRLGFYAMVGEASTYYLTSGGGIPIPGSGIGNKSFSREGFVGQFYAGPHVGLTVVTQHGSDNVWFGQGYGNAEATDSNGGTTCLTPIPNGCPPNNVPGTVLPVGAQAPSWNGVTFEGHYVYSPQLIFIGRYEAEKMSQQANNGPGSLDPVASNFGNISTYTIGFRYNPFMTSRAGLAWHNEYNWLHQDGTGPSLGLASANVNTGEILIGLDFDF